MRLQDESDTGNHLAGNGLFDPPPAAPTAASLKFNKDNVLQVGHIVRIAVDEARAKVQDLASYMQVRPCGEDIVSKEAAKAWNARLTGGPESYAERLLEYIQNVSDLADQLKETAKQYGYTDEEITNAFKSIEVQSV
jgi:hypothetical protein